MFRDRLAWVYLFAALGCGEITSYARADEPVEVYASCQFSSCIMPSPITGIRRVHAGRAAIIVETAGGYLRWWRSTSYYGNGGTFGPCDLTRGVGVGAGHLVAVGLTGNFQGLSFDYQGYQFGQLNAPQDLGAIQKITAGYHHTVVLRTDGSIRCFGRNDYGQCDGPIDANFSSVTSKWEHSAAMRADGSIVCWGYNAFGQCTVPADLPPARSVTTTVYSTVALLPDGTTRQWGQVITPPSQIPPLEVIDGGPSHLVGRTASGEVYCWGSDGNGECGGVGTAWTRRRPAQLGNVVSIAAGDGVTATVDSSGKFVAWGYDYYGDCTLPQPIQPIRAVANSLGSPLWLRSDGAVIARPGFSLGGYQRFDAEGLRANALVGALSSYVAGLVAVDGSLHLWGTAPLRQIPPSARYVQSAAVGGAHAVVIDRAGKVRSWTSSNDPSLLPMPTGIGQAAQVAAGANHALAVSTKGRVYAWGYNYAHQCDVPVDLPPVRMVAADGESSLALLQDGSIRAWGGYSGQPEQIPSSVGALVWLEASGNYRIGRRADGTWVGWYRDATSLGFEGTRLWSTNGIDLYCQTPYVDITAPSLPAIGFGVPVEYTFEVPRLAAADVQLQISAVSDLNTSTEFASMRIDGAPYSTLFVADGADCPTNPDYAYITIPRLTFNQFAADGRMTVRLDGSAAVNGTQCVTGYTLIRLSYTAAILDCNGNGITDACDIASRDFEDCDRNGIPDVCDFASGSAVDFDGNGVLDACEPDCNGNELPDAFEIATGAFEDCNGNLIPDTCDTAFGELDKDADGRIDDCEIARGDFDLSGFIDGADLGALLTLWGFANPPYGDIDQDGVVAGGDLAILLGSWGPIP